MSQFDAAGGPWGYRLRPNLLDKGIDVYIEAGTFTGQTAPQLQGTIPDQTIYAGAMTDGETYLVRHNWYNQGAHYRAEVANYPSYPGVTVVDYYHLFALASFLPELVVQLGGSVDLAPLLPLLGNADHRRRILPARTARAAQRMRGHPRAAHAARDCVEPRPGRREHPRDARRPPRRVRRDVDHVGLHHDQPDARAHARSGQG